MNLLLDLENFLSDLKDTLKRDQYVSSIFILLAAFNPFVIKKCGIMKLKQVDFYGNKHKAAKYLWKVKIHIK